MKLSRIVLLLALLCLPLQAYTVKPEVFWFTIQDQGERVGFGRGEYVAAHNGQYDFKYVLVLHGQTKTGEIGNYRFDQDLRPLSFNQTTLYAGRTQSVTNTFGGDFDWTKGMVRVKTHEFDADKGDYKDTSTSVPLVKNSVSLFTTNVALAHAKLAAGKKFDYTVFSPKTKAFVTQHFDIQQRDPKTGQFKVVLSSPDTPGEDRTFWFLPPTPKHQNGYITLSTFSTGGHDFRFQAASREQAIQGFEEEVRSMGL